MKLNLVEFVQKNWPLYLPRDQLVDEVVPLGLLADVPHGPGGLVVPKKPVAHDVPR